MHPQVHDSSSNFQMGDCGILHMTTCMTGNKSINKPIVPMFFIMLESLIPKKRNFLIMKK